ncbi:menaquinone biosynthesis prenyltransferase MqnP [Spirilliplanes yamanashiensis]|uniref:4-hydroxybenzoate polyprenyltransferase n=1 Tax=Spirilliplanes yamanashiensis TaxID=42233 RepID=A0A8J3Y917_9ACTN|nr:menaquinone biosynthesis prenyltransferase MqnP [Spirilliplanes yamanashiensis]MDP9815310.1 4-hydroxybenzoate polyprenyltransferase [Spirilliplanes yamanashiensis]GIJ03564.1 4-hydroxybenzoate octaprenyltransferase [Spirilliplanes yamanashiensis]
MTLAPEQPGRVKAFLRLVAVEHSVFALPFAYLATLTAMLRDGGTVRWGVLLLVTVAMVGGRTFAMAANRILDRKIDALNPRTRNRELVTGAVSLRTAWTGAAVSLAVLFAAAAALNPLCLVLSPLAVIPLVVYPYAKRFTNFPHFVLALAQAVAPVGAWLAVTGTFAGSGPAWVLAAAVGLWIGGFDLIYACQDVDVDREIGVHSTPARYGVRAALHLSTVTHVVTFALFVWFGELVGLGWPWWIGLVLTAAAFAYQHVVVTPRDLSRVNRAFFTANGFVGIALFLFALLDLVLRLGLRA